MLLLVFFIATLNLGVGYALGAKLTLADLLEMIPRRKKGEEDLAEEESLTASPAEATSEDPAPELSAKVETQEEPPAEPTTPPPAEKLNPADVMASLSKFRENLAEASTELQTNPDQFEQSASKLQEANHAYLEKADSAIQQLNELGEAGDQAAVATCSAVSRGAEKVAQISGEIDGIIDEGLDSEDARSSLLDKAKAADQAAADCEAEANQAAQAQPPEETPPVEGPPASTSAAEHATIDELFDQLDMALEAAGDESALHVAAIRVDPIAGQEGNSELASHVEEQLLRFLQDAMTDNQTVASGSPAMALLSGDNFEEAIERVEAVRKQVHSTPFSTPEGEISATVTCALADAHTGDSREKLIEQINLALDESTRNGGNCTYHHDGAFPTVVGEAAEAAAD